MVSSIGGPSQVLQQSISQSLGTANKAQQNFVADPGYNSSLPSFSGYQFDPSKAIAAPSGLGSFSNQDASNQLKGVTSLGSQLNQWLQQLAQSSPELQQAMAANGMSGLSLTQLGGTAGLRALLESQMKNAMGIFKQASANAAKAAQNPSASSKSQGAQETASNSESSSKSSAPEAKKKKKGGIGKFFGNLLGTATDFVSKGGLDLFKSDKKDGETAEGKKEKKGLDIAGIAKIASSIFG